MFFAQQEKGQGLIEYALILVFIALLVIVVLRILGPGIGGVFSSMNSILTHTT